MSSSKTPSLTSFSDHLHSPYSIDPSSRASCKVQAAWWRQIVREAEQMNGLFARPLPLSSFLAPCSPVFLNLSYTCRAHPSPDKDPHVVFGNTSEVPKNNRCKMEQY
jgi:hypothetical protein